MPHWSDQAQQTAGTELRAAPPGQVLARCEPPPEPAEGLLIWSEDLPEELGLEFAAAGGTDEQEAAQSEAELEFHATAEAYQSDAKENDNAFEFLAEDSRDQNAADERGFELEFTTNGSRESQASRGELDEQISGHDPGLTFDATGPARTETEQDDDVSLEFTAAARKSSSAVPASNAAVESPPTGGTISETSADAVEAAGEADLGLAFETATPSAEREAEVEPQLEFTAERATTASARASEASAASDSTNSNETEAENARTTEAEASEAERFTFATSPAAESEVEDAAVPNLQFTATPVASGGSEGGPDAASDAPANESSSAEAIAEAEAIESERLRFATSAEAEAETADANDLGLAFSATPSAAGRTGSDVTGASGAPANESSSAEALAEAEAIESERLRFATSAEAEAETADANDLGLAFSATPPVADRTRIGSGPPSSTHAPISENDAEEATASGASEPEGFTFATAAPATSEAASSAEPALQFSANGSSTSSSRSDASLLSSEPESESFTFLTAAEASETLATDPGLMFAANHSLDSTGDASQSNQAASASAAESFTFSAASEAATAAADDSEFEFSASKIGEFRGVVSPGNLDTTGNEAEGFTFTASPAIVPAEEVTDVGLQFTATPTDHPSETSGTAGSESTESASRDGEEPGLSFAAEAGTQDSAPDDLGLGFATQGTTLGAFSEADATNETIPPAELLRFGTSASLESSTTPAEEPDLQITFASSRQGDNSLHAEAPALAEAAAEPVLEFDAESMASCAARDAEEARFEFTANTTDSPHLDDGLVQQDSVAESDTRMEFAAASNTECVSGALDRDSHGQELALSFASDQHDDAFADGMRLVFAGVQPADDDTDSI